MLSGDEWHGPRVTERDRESDSPWAFRPGPFGLIIYMDEPRMTRENYIA
jgi:hypothetical protein